MVCRTSYSGLSANIDISGVPPCKTVYKNGNTQENLEQSYEETSDRHRLLTFF